MAIRELPPDLAEIARTQVNEDPKRVPQDIQAIKDWLKKQPHLTAREDDQWILTFLRGCKFSLERTKEKIDTYYSMRSMLPEFFKQRDPLNPTMQEILKMGMATPLGSDLKGRSVMLMRHKKFDPKKINMNEMMKSSYMNMDIMLRENDRIAIAGEVMIIDFKHVSMDVVTHLTPTLVKKMMTCFQEAYPIRPQAVHYINTSPVFETIFSLFKSFMKKKLQDRIHIHAKDMASLYEHVPQSIMPNEYGGTAGPVEELAEKWRKNVESYRTWLAEDEKFGSDETKRLGKPKTESTYFGIEGSFRNLSVD